jgi:hypothetical protein
VIVLGNIFEDAWDTVTDPITSAWDAAKSTVPGLQEISDAIDAAVSGPVRDFARGPIGRVMFSALASSLTGGLAPILGPQLATVAFALPGLAKGDDFVTAWTQEFAERAKTVAAQLGSEEAGDALNDALGKLTAYAQTKGLDIAALVNQVDWHALAAQLNIREDILAQVISGAIGDLDFSQSKSFDPKTGKELHFPTALDKAKQIAADAEKRAAAIAKRAQLDAGKRASSLAAGPGSFKAMLSTTIAPLPTVSTVRATSPDAPKTSVAGDVALGLLIAGAVGALVIWKS